MTLLAFQGIGIDPTPFTAWGVLGLLGLVLLVFAGVIWKLFSANAVSMETRDKILMDFVNVHRGETQKSLDAIADKVVDSHKTMAQAFGRQARALDEVLLTGRVLDQIEKRKVAGTQLTTEEIDRVVHALMRERAAVRSTDQ